MTLDQLNASAREGGDALVQALTGEAFVSFVLIFGGGLVGLMLLGCAGGAIYGLIAKYRGVE